MHTEQVDNIKKQDDTIVRRDGIVARFADEEDGGYNPLNNRQRKKKEVEIHNTTK